MPHLNDACAPSPNIVLRCEAGGRAMARTVAGSAGSHDDWTSAETAAGRNVGLSLWRGVRGRCPRCGRGRLFCAFLKVDDHCSVCRLDFTGHRADDLPAYLVIVIVGHIVVPTVLLIETNYSPPVWFAFVSYLPVTLVASLPLLQPLQGTVVGLQWALRMHGFDGNAPSEIPPV